MCWCCVVHAGGDRRRRARRHPGRAASAPRPRRSSGRRQRRADHPEPGAVRLPAAAAAHRRHRRAHRDRRARSSTRCCRSCARRSPGCAASIRRVVEAGVAMGMTPRPAAPAGRAAAGAAVDRRGHPRRRGHRRRHGHDRRRHRRRRPRRVHLPRPVDGRHDGDPGRRRSGGRCWRSPPTALLALARARAARAPARRADGASRRRWRSALLAVADRRGRCARRRERGADRRRLEELHRAGHPRRAAGAGDRSATGLPVDRRLNLGGTFICDRALRAGRHRRLRRVHGHGADRGLQAAGRTRSGAGARRGPRPLRRPRASRRCAARLQQHVRDSRAGRGRPGARAADDRRSRAASRRVARRGSATSSWSAPTAIPDSRGLRPAVRASRRAAMDLSLIYRALAERQVDLIAGDATSGLIEASTW